MSNNESLVFPQLLLLNDYSGNFDAFMKAVYTVFYQSFINKQAVYRGVKIIARKFPEVDGMHRTFYHITHEGDIESERIPDIARMERIRYPRFIIDNEIHPEILIWENQRGNDQRILLFNEAESYLVVLTLRKEVLLFWTAYPVDQDHTIRKLLKEYQVYVKAKTA